MSELKNSSKKDPVSWQYRILLVVCQSSYLITLLWCVVESVIFYMFDTPVFEFKTLVELLCTLLLDETHWEFTRQANCFQFNYLITLLHKLLHFFPQSSLQKSRQLGSLTSRCMCSSLLLGHTSDFNQSSALLLTVFTYCCITLNLNR